MAYRLLIGRAAEKEFDAIPEPLHRRIAAKIENLAQNPRPIGSIKLKGADDEYRVRVGDYRILYLVNDQSKSVTVVAVGHRREIYR